MSPRRAGVPAPETTSTSSTALDELTGAAPGQVVVQLVDVALLRPHPRNPRRDLGDLTELVESIRAQGVRQNLLVVPDPDEPGAYRIVIGHRRAAGAREAGLIRVPAAIDTTLTDAAQLELMLLENLQRVDLSPVEEADGYQGLLDLGLDVAAIASTTGRSQTTVRSRLKLVTLPERARQAVHTHTATLEDAAALAEFDGEVTSREQLAKHLGTSSFALKLRQARERAETDALFAPYLERLREAKVTERPGAGPSWAQHEAPSGLRKACSVGSWNLRADAGPVVAGFEADLDRALAETGWAWRWARTEYSAELILFRPATLDEAEVDAAQDAKAAARDLEVEQKRAAEAERKALAQTTAALRVEFLRARLGRAITGKAAEAVRAYIADTLVMDTWDTNGALSAEPGDFLPWLGIDEDAIIAQADADDLDAMDAVEQAMLTAAAALTPEQRMLAVAAAAIEPVPHFRLRSRWTRAWYALLEALGYAASSDELAAIAEQVG